MRSKQRLRKFDCVVFGFAACLYISGSLAAQQSTPKTQPTAPPQQTPQPAASISLPAGVNTFASPEAAVDALLNAATKYDVAALTGMFGPDSKELLVSSEPAQDRQRVADFVAAMTTKKSISKDPKSPNRAFLLVGNDNWPFPIPIVKSGDKWFFDGKTGRQEILYRRIGSNELDVINICHGYVEAQLEYATAKRQGYEVNQYAQRIISTQGKQDGLAWQKSDGSWDGPVGENIAKAIQQGYSQGQPYHGYFFKVLKGQGPAAPLGELDFVIKGAMIGGFALVASPAEYGVTGVQTFVVSQNDVVFQKDFGPMTAAAFKTMERYNPDNTWKRAEP